MKFKGSLIGAISLLILISLWGIVSVVMNSPFILPSPLNVLKDLLLLFKNTLFISMLRATFIRGIISFTVSLIISFVLGIFSGLSAGFTRALQPWMTVIKSTPVVAFVLLAILWFGSSIVPIFVSVLMTVPVMTEAIATGVRSTDSKLLEMARIYRFTTKDRLLHIQLPSALPFFLSGAGSSLGLTWKVVVAGEILAFPKNGIGTAMQTAKVHLETPRVFSLTIIAIFFSIITEWIFDRMVKASKKHQISEGRKS